MVVELADRIARRQALDASLFGGDVLVTRYDERFGGCVHCTPNEASIVAQSLRVEGTLGLACKVLAARYGRTMLGALPSLELYFRNPLSRLRHTTGTNEASLQFHIEKNDFGSLATVLDLVSQDLRKKGHPSTAETLLRQRDRLMYLQSGYRIEKIECREGDSQPAIRSGLASFS